MARNLAPACKQCRRVGEKLFLKGEKCFTPKCPVVRRGTPPGMHGAASGRRPSNYSIQLREKQKARKMYGLLERQFRIYFERALTARVNTGDQLLRLLELRLDNIVYRAGFAPSRNAARQIVSHGHVAVNGQRVDIPSYHARPTDRVAIHPSRVGRNLFRDLQKELTKHQPPTWLTVDGPTLTATIQVEPDTQELHQSINPQLIVEFYSR